MFKRILISGLLVIAGAITGFAQENHRRNEQPTLLQPEAVDGDETEDMPARLPVQYKTNIVSLAPVTAMDIGLGFGLSYEKIFGKKGMVALILPLSYIMEDRGGGYFTGEQTVSSNHSYIYFTPGVKIYPFGQRRVTYAFGVNLMLGYGGGKEWRGIYDPGFAPMDYVQTDITKTRLGAIVNNYVNFQISPLFNLGLQAGLGTRYLDRHTEENSAGTKTFRHGMAATGQASLTLGFRF